jgi:hypothetical protein
MRRGIGRAAAAIVAAGASLATGATARADEATVPGCTVRLASVSPENVPTFLGECVWSVEPAWVSAVLVEPERFNARSSMLRSTEHLPDGRIVNVQKTGWPFEDRQSTIEVSDEPLPGGGVVRRYRLASAQAPLAEGAVQVGVDEGSWTVMPHPNGTRVVLEMKYEPGGNLPTKIVQSMSPKYIARGLDELRANAEKVAATRPALPGVASGPEAD